MVIHRGKKVGRLEVKILQMNSCSVDKKYNRMNDCSVDKKVIGEWILIGIKSKWSFMKKYYRWIGIHSL